MKSNGTVVAIGANDDGRINVDSWNDITAISAGTFHTVGLKSDGRTLVGGANSNLDNFIDIKIQ